MPPRAAVPVRQPQSDAAGVAEAVARATEGVGPGHVLLDSLRQAVPDHSQLTRALFEPTKQVSGALADLAFELARLDLSRVPPTPGLPGAQAVLIAQALAAATGGNAQLALSALEALRGLDPQQEIIAAWQQRVDGQHDHAGSVHSKPEGSVASDGEWSVSVLPGGSSSASLNEHGAVEPARAPDGCGDVPRVARQAAWRVAIALAATPSGMDVLQAVVARPVDEAKRRDFALLLKAAAVMPAGGAAGVDPVAILASDAAHATLAGEAVACAAARMAGDVEAAHPHRWALTAVSNDLFVTGAGSDFAAVNARLMKMGRWIERATPERARRVRNPFFGKSPFRALRHGTQGVDRGPAIARHRLARETALREAAAALKDQLVGVAPRARSPGPGRVPEVLLRAAVLEHCLQTPAPQALERAGFDADARADIADRLARMLAPGPVASVTEGGLSLAPRLSELPELRALADVRLDARTLAQWFSQAHKTSRDTGVATQNAPEESPWVQAVSNALKRAQEEVVGSDTRVPVVNRDTVRSALKDIIANIEGSSRLRLSSGGVVGVGLRQLTASITALASAFFLRGRLDARAQRSRQAVFEIAMPPYDMEVVFGTQRQVAGQVGVGAFVGPDIGVAKAGINIDTVLYGTDSAAMEGISLRLPRVGRPVAELRAEFSTLVDAVLDGSEGGSKAGEGPPLLRRLLQEFPELTVNRIACAGDGRRRHGLGADIAGSIGKGAAKVSASAGGFVEAQRKVTRHYADATGRMRVERSIVGHATKVGGGIRASISATDALASQTAVSGKVDLSIAAAQVGVSAERIRSGLFDRREAVYEDGHLHPLSFVETEYNNVQAFLASMEPQIDAWVDAGIDRARLDELMARIRQHEAPIHSFATRCTVTPETRARDDVYRSALQLCAQHPSGLRDAVSAFESAIEAQWKDPAAVQPYSIRSYERNLVQRTQGAELVLQLSSQDAAEASHIDNRLDVPTQRPVQSVPGLRSQPPQTTPEITLSSAARSAPSASRSGAAMPDTQSPLPARRHASGSSSHGSTRAHTQLSAAERLIPYAVPLPVAMPVDVTPDALANVPMAQFGPRLQAPGRRALTVMMPLDLAAVPMAELADLSASRWLPTSGGLPVVGTVDEAGMTPEELVAVPMAELYPTVPSGVRLPEPPEPVRGADGQVDAQATGQAQVRVLLPAVATLIGAGRDHAAVLAELQTMQVATLYATLERHAVDSFVAYAEHGGAAPDLATAAAVLEQIQFARIFAAPAEPILGVDEAGSSALVGELTARSHEREGGLARQDLATHFEQGRSRGIGNACMFDTLYQLAERAGHGAQLRPFTRGAEGEAARAAFGHRMQELLAQTGLLARTPHGGYDQFELDDGSFVANLLAQVTSLRLIVMNKTDTGVQLSPAAGREGPEAFIVRTVTADKDGHFEPMWPLDRRESRPDHRQRDAVTEWLANADGPRGRIPREVTGAAARVAAKHLVPSSPARRQKSPETGLASTPPRSPAGGRVRSPDLQPIRLRPEGMPPLGTSLALQPLSRSSSAASIEFPAPGTALNQE